MRCGVPSTPLGAGPRKAKELLLTGDSIDAEKAYRLGAVNKAFPPERLEEDTLNLVRRIARPPTITTLLIKEGINQTQDIQGFYSALKAAFSLHQLNRAHWAEMTKGSAYVGTPEFDVSQEWKRIMPADKSSSGYRPE